MKKFLLLALLSVSTLFASNIEVKDAYVRATPPGLPNSAAFMVVENNTDKKISIVKATSNVSKVVELHTHSMKDGVMKMYQVPKVDIPANGKTELKPGGFHVMLIGLHNPLKIGEEVTYTLEFSNGETKTITAPIKTVMGGMMKKQMKKGMSCGSGKCGSN
ncbi:MAG: copper chaperone PCu(A)C [Arcobacter sp.]|uniref:copper chaperone PCu(A)C n=1 Tax=Arcobacter sp. TaxID=1872629 RepID=UPI003B00EF99